VDLEGCEAREWQRMVIGEEEFGILVMFVGKVRGHAWQGGDGECCYVALKVHIMAWW